MNNNENNDSQNNEKGIFKTRGFYIVLAICIIAVASILIATLQSAPGETTNNQEQAQAEDSVQNIDNPSAESLTEAQKQQQSPAASPTASASAATPSASEVPKNRQKAEIVIAKPVNGDIAAVFCVDNLVYNKTLNIWQTHNGIDIVPKDNAEVKAALAGEISEVVEDPSYGNMIVIKHSNNLITKYAGLAEVSVKAGDKVQKGDVIGTVGTPPFEAHMGTHIHFEVWEGDNPIDPTEVFEQQ